MPVSSSDPQPSLYLRETLISGFSRLIYSCAFLLTDAEEEISALALRRIGDLARRTGVSQINVIEFGKPGGRHPAAYRKLAEENGGAYVYKDVTSLK